jgi:hypothetical protein
MPQQMHITAVPYPSGKQEFALDDEIRIIKASLLYADKVLLISIIPMLIFSLPNMIDELAKDQKTQQEMENIKSNITNELINNAKNYKGSKEEIDKIQEYLKDKNVSIEGFVKDEANSSIHRMSGIFVSAWNELKSNLGVNKLDQAIKSGLLEVYTIPESVIPDNTFPLLDENVFKMFKENMGEREINFTETEEERLKQIGLVFEIFKRLPNFENATINEVIDIRKTLEKPLIRFRSAIIDMSETIKYEPWSKNFKYDVEKLFYRKIEPSILEIEEECKTNKYLLELVNTITEKPLEIPAGGISGAIISKLSTISNISATAIGLTLGTGTIAYKALRKWKEKTKKIEDNQMFFYYKTGKILKK